MERPSTGLAELRIRRQQTIDSGNPVPMQRCINPLEKISLSPPLSHRDQRYRVRLRRYKGVGTSWPCFLSWESIPWTFDESSAWYDQEVTYCTFTKHEMHNEVNPGAIFSRRCPYAQLGREMTCTAVRRTKQAAQWFNRCRLLPHESKFRGGDF